MSNLCETQCNASVERGEGEGARRVAEQKCDIYCAHPSQGLLQAVLKTFTHTLAACVNKLLLFISADLSHCAAQCGR